MGTRAEGFAKLPSLSNSKNLRTSLRKSGERKPAYTAITATGSRQKLKVRFVLPETEKVDEKSTASRGRLNAVPLPAICEFVIFNDKPNGGKRHMERRGFSSVQKTHLGYRRVNDITNGILKEHTPLVSAMRNCEGDSKTFGTKLAITAETNLLNHATTQVPTSKATLNCKFTTKELKIESKCKMPEDFKEPTYLDTKKRILEWLKYSQAFTPSNRRQAKRVQKYEY